MKGVIRIEFKKIEEGIIPIYENDSKERLINARELHQALECSTKFVPFPKANQIVDMLKIESL